MSERGAARQRSNEQSESRLRLELRKIARWWRPNCLGSVREFREARSNPGLLFGGPDLRGIIRYGSSRSNETTGGGGRENCSPGSTRKNRAEFLRQSDRLVVYGKRLQGRWV